MTFPGKDLPEQVGGGLSREEKDEIRKGFGTRLRELLELTGLSSREFAQRYPAHNDSTVRKYTSGRSLPAWDFLRDLLAEAARRTDDQAGAQRARELFVLYRSVLIRIGAEPHGSDQNSLLLRLFDGEQTLRQLNEEIRSIGDRENQLRAEIEELRATANQADQERAARLEQENQDLAQRHRDLAARRRELVGDLDRSRQHLTLLETADSVFQPPAGVPPLPPKPPRAVLPPPARTHRHFVRIAAAAAAVVVLVGGGAAVGIWISGGDSSDDEAAGSTSPTHSSSTVLTTFSPSTAANTGTPTPTSDIESASPGATKPATTELLTKLSMVAYGGDVPDYRYLNVGRGVVDNVSYPYQHALVSHVSGGDCDGYSEYNLSREWKKLTMVIGIDDNSTGHASSVEIELDGESIWKEDVHLGSARKVILNVTNGLRLRISFNDTDISKYPCTMGDLVIGNPTLSR